MEVPDRPNLKITITLLYYSRPNFQCLFKIIMTIIIIKIAMIMIRTDKTDRVSSHHSELVDVPVGEVGLVHDGHLDDNDNDQ